MSRNIPNRQANTRYIGWAATPARFLLISLYWLPVSLFWGAMLGQIIPARVEAFSGAAHSGSHLAVLSICGAAMGLLVQIVIGPISDRCAARWGRRRPFLFFGTVLAIAAMLGFGHAGSFAGLVLAFVGIQLFLNIATGPYQAMIPDQVPQDRQGAASGFMGVMQLLGEAGGPIVAGLLLGKAATPAMQAHGIQIFMVIVATLLGLFMALTVLLVPDAPASLAKAQSLRQNLRETYHFRIAENPDFYKLLVSRAVFNLGFYTAFGFLAYYVHYSLHAGPTYQKPLTQLLEIAIGGALIGTLPAGYLADRMSKKTVIYASSLFSVAAGLAFALAPTILFAQLMAALFGIGYGMFRAVDWAFATNLLPQGGGAKFMAIWSLSTMLPQVIAPSFGPVADWLNHSLGMGVGYRGAMFATLIYTLIGTALVSRVHEKSNISAAPADSGAASKTAATRAAPPAETEA